MKNLKVDNKWSIDYDDNMNDRPVRFLRYGQEAFLTPDNIHTALFYALLEKSNEY